MLAFNQSGDNPGGWWVVTLSASDSVFPSIDGMWTNLKGKFSREILTNISLRSDRSTKPTLHCGHVDQVIIKELLNPAELLHCYILRRGRDPDIQRNHWSFRPQHSKVRHTAGLFVDYSCSDDDRTLLGLWSILGQFSTNQDIVQRTL